MPELKMAFGISYSRDGGILILIHLFGLAYFFFFLLQLVLYQFPRSPHEIPNALAVIFYASSLRFWCFSTIVYRTLSAFSGEQALPWLNVEGSGILTHIYATAAAFVLLQFSHQSYLQLAYLVLLTVTVVGNLVEIVQDRSAETGSSPEFGRRCLSLGVVALVPVVHVLSQTLPSPPTLVVEYIRLFVSSSLGGLCALLALPERLGLTGDWRPSLYAMHLILILSNVVFSKSILAAVA